MISIVIPTFNEEEYLPLLLESIKNQSFTDYEVIVADNGSTDHTIDIAKQYGAIVTTGGMPGKGRNEGAKIAKGDVLLFLDADVILKYKFYLTDCLNEFLLRQLDMATCRVTPLSLLKRDIWFHEFYNVVMLVAARISPYAPGFCIFAKTSAHNAIQGFDEAVFIAEDSDYVKRASKLFKFGVLKSQKILVSVRRLERDGRINIIIKYLLCSVYMFFFGSIKTNIFNYTFGHSKKK